jgi:hypothetical protein
MFIPAKTSCPATFILERLELVSGAAKMLVRMPVRVPQTGPEFHERAKKSKNIETF